MSTAPSRVRHMHYRKTTRIRHSGIMLGFMEERSNTLSATATSPWDWQVVGTSSPHNATIANHDMTKPEGPYWVADGNSALPNLLPNTPYYLGNAVGTPDWTFRFYRDPQEAILDTNAISLDSDDVSDHEMNQAISNYSIVDGAWKKGYSSQQLSNMTAIADFPTLPPVLPIV